jgi:DNA polymerase elongation subunit (family B)
LIFNSRRHFITSNKQQGKKKRKSFFESTENEKEENKMNFQVFDICARDLVAKSSFVNNNSNKPQYANPDRFTTPTSLITPKGATNRPLLNILLFCRKSSGESACIRVSGFQPSFYVELLAGEAYQTFLKNADEDSINEQEEQAIYEGLIRKLDKFFWGVEQNIPDAKDSNASSWYRAEMVQKKKTDKCWVERDPVSKKLRARTFPFARVSFTSIYALQRARQRLLSLGYVLHEHTFEIFQKFTTETAIVAGKWLEFPLVGSGKLRGPLASESLLSTCTEEYCTHFSQISHVKIYSSVPAPFILASFDIECKSVDGSFPSAKRPGDSIISITTVFSRLTHLNDRKQDCVETVCLLPKGYGYPFYLAKYAAIFGYLGLPPHVRCFHREQDLLTSFAESVVKHDVDILTGYNIHNFDLMYMRERATLLKCLPMFLNFSRIRQEKVHMEMREMRAFGRGLAAPAKHKHPQQQQQQQQQVETVFFGHCTGRLMLDLYKEMSKRILDEYSLSFVSRKYLKQDKLDMPASALFRKYERGCIDEDLKMIADYNQQDCFLVLSLLSRQQIILTVIEMACITLTPPIILFQQGQIVKTRNQRLFDAARENYVLVVQSQSQQSHGGGDELRVGETEDNPEKYSGARVIEPKCGLYGFPSMSIACASSAKSSPVSASTPVPVTATTPTVSTPASTPRPIQENPTLTLDFQSMYPSIMKAENLDSTTKLDFEDVQRLNMIENVEYKKHNVTEEKEEKKTEDPPRYHYFCLVIPGLAPTALHRLLTQRTLTKDKMKRVPEDSLDYQIYDKQQLEYKLSGNSYYGFFGTQWNPCACIAVSETVTAIGRRISMETERQIVQDFKGVVIYGDTDSVMVQFAEAKTVADCFRIGEAAAKQMTQFFKGLIVLSVDKVYERYILYKKKHYIGWLWKSLSKPPELDIKGIKVVRRDATPICKALYKAVIQKLIVGATSDVQGALQTIAQYAQQMADGKLSYEDAKLQTKYNAVKKAKSLHHYVADRIRERSPLEAPKSGDRVSYVILQPTYQQWLLEFRKKAAKAETKKHAVSTDNKTKGPQQPKRPQPTQQPLTNLFRIKMSNASSSAPKPQQQQQHQQPPQPKKMPSEEKMSKEVKVGMKAEDYSYAKLKQLPLDHFYYLEKSIIEPMRKLFVFFAPGIRNRIEDISERSRQAIERRLNKKSNQAAAPKLFHSSKR